MRFKEYLTEVKEEKDPREKDKVATFGVLIQKHFGLKMGKPTKGRGDFIYTFKSKGLDLGRTTLRLQSSFGDITFGESSGVFTSLDAQKAKEKATDAYEKKFGARGVEGAKTFKQVMKDIAKKGR